MKPANHHFANKAAGALAGFLDEMRGHRLDKRSVIAGFYAAAALLATVSGKDAELVDHFTNLGADAIQRVKS